MGETFPEAILEDPDEEKNSSDDNRGYAKVVHVVSDFRLEVSETVGSRQAFVKIQGPVEETGVADAAAGVLRFEVSEDLDASVNCLRVGHVRGSG